MLACELTSFATVQSMWNWSYYSCDKRFHARLCVSPRITRGLSESHCWCTFHGKRHVLCRTRQSRDGHSRKIYEDPVYESMTPTCLCFSSRVTPYVSRADKPLASIDSLLFHIANTVLLCIRPQSFPTKCISSNVIYFSANSIPCNKVLFLILEAN